MSQGKISQNVVQGEGLANAENQDRTEHKSMAWDPDLGQLTGNRDLTYPHECILTHLVCIIKLD